MRILTKSVIGLMAAAALALTACSPEAGSSDPSATEATRLNIGLIPIVDVAPIYVGIEQGFFEEEGIELEITQAAGGAALLPAVVAGDLQFAFNSVTSLIIAEHQGLDVTLIAAGAASTGDPDADYGNLVVPAGSDIASPKDLEGKSVGVNALKGVAEMVIRYGVEQDGGDPDLVNYVEIAPSETAAALANAQVDASWAAEPFVTVTTQQGATPIYAGYAEPIEDMLIAGYFTTAAYAAENPDVVGRFLSAVTKSVEYATANPDAARAAVATYTEIPQEVIDALILPSYPSTINTESVELQNELAAKYGFISEEIDINTLFE